MPVWMTRMLRMSAIGLGVTMMLLAGINLYAMHALFDVSVENQLGVTPAELRPLFYILMAIGLFVALMGIFARVPQSWLKAEPLPARKRKLRRRGSTR
jgi:hypothetical protein